MDELVRVTMVQGLLGALLLSIFFILYHGDCLIDDWKSGRSVFRKNP